MSEERVYGLYKRENKNATEYLCLKADKSYSHFLLRNGEKEKLSDDKWHFSVQNKESRIGLSNFEKYGISSPILFSHAKGMIVIRMNIDDHHRDFTRIADSCRAEDEELGFLTTKLQQYPDNSIILTSIAKIKIDNADFSEAIKILDRAVSADSSNRHAFFYRGHSRLMVKDFSGAKDDFDRACSLVPE